jgi:hypothetical protein
MVQIVEKKDEELGLSVSLKLEGGSLALDAKADLAKLLLVGDQKIDAGKADAVLSAVMQILIGLVKAA